MERKQGSEEEEEEEEEEEWEEAEEDEWEEAEDGDNEQKLSCALQTLAEHELGETEQVDHTFHLTY